MLKQHWTRRSPGDLLEEPGKEAAGGKWQGAEEPAALGTVFGLLLGVLLENLLLGFFLGTMAGVAVGAFQKKR